MARVTEAKLQALLRDAKAYANGKTSPTLTRGLNILMRHGKTSPAPKKKSRLSINEMKRLLDTPRRRWTVLQQQIAEALDRAPTEEWIHGQFMQWVRDTEESIPDLKYLYHPANGGMRNMLVAMLMRLLGVRKGTPDIHWPLPRSNYTGLWIEFKRKGEKPTSAQTDWHDWLRHNGAYVIVLTDWHTARDITLWYHGLPERNSVCQPPQ